MHPMNFGGHQSYPMQQQQAPPLPPPQQQQQLPMDGNYNHGQMYLQQQPQPGYNPWFANQPGQMNQGMMAKFPPTYFMPVPMGMPMQQQQSHGHPFPGYHQPPPSSASSTATAPSTTSSHPIPTPSGLQQQTSETAINQKNSFVKSNNGDNNSSADNGIGNNSTNQPHFASSVPQSSQPPSSRPEAGSSYSPYMSAQNTSDQSKSYQQQYQQQQSPSQPQATSSLPQLLMGIQNYNNSNNNSAISGNNNSAATTTSSSNNNNNNNSNNNNSSSSRSKSTSSSISGSSEDSRSGSGSGSLSTPTMVGPGTGRPIFESAPTNTQNGNAMASSTKSTNSMPNGNSQTSNDMPEPPKGSSFPGSYYGQPIFVMMPPQDPSAGQMMPSGGAMIPMWGPAGPYMGGMPMGQYGPMMTPQPGGAPFMGMPQGLYAFPGGAGGSMAVQKRRRKRRKSNRCSSSYRGVSWHKRDHRWVARAWINGKTENLGTYISEKHAALMVDSKLIEAYGPSAEALLNFPDPKEREEVAHEIEKEIQLEFARERERGRRPKSPLDKSDGDETKDQTSLSDDSGYMGKGRDSDESYEKTQGFSSSGSRFDFTGSNNSTESGSDGDSRGNSSRSFSGDHHRKHHHHQHDESFSKKARRDNNDVRTNEPIKKRAKVSSDEFLRRKAVTKSKTS